LRRGLKKNRPAGLVVRGGNAARRPWLYLGLSALCMRLRAAPRWRRLASGHIKRGGGGGGGEPRTPKGAARSPPPVPFEVPWNWNWSFWNWNQNQSGRSRLTRLPASGALCLCLLSAAARITQHAAPPQTDPGRSKRARWTTFSPLRRWAMVPVPLVAVCSEIHKRLVRRGCARREIL
jgi:hypothetical protein